MRLRNRIFLGLVVYSLFCQPILAAKKQCAPLERLGKAFASGLTAKQKEREVLRAMKEDPGKLFIEVRREMMKTRRPDGDFQYSIFAPVLERIIDDIQTRINEDLPQNEKDLLRPILEKAIALQADGIPYKKSMRLTFEYLHALDTIFLRLHPELSGSFHRTHAEHVLEPLLEKAPDVLLYPSFGSVGFSFFNASRTAPMHIVGIHPSGLRPNEKLPFADAFYMKPSEFAWHDIGHVEFMEEKDSQYINQSFKPIERIVQEWDFTRHRIEKFVDSFSGQKNLKDAMVLILFEILHERGYQYSLSILKSQLDTPKWTEIIRRKLNNDYYREFTWVNMNLFPELENARQKLLAFVDETRRSDQKKHIAALYGENLAVRVTHYPKVGFANGDLQKIEIEDADNITAVCRSGTDKRTHKPSINDLILAQISPTKNTPFDADTMQKINGVLRMRALKAPVGLGATKTEVSKIVLDSRRRIWVQTADKKQVPLASFEVPPDYLKGEPIVIDRQFFEMNQALGSAELNKPLAFTLRKPPQVYLGTISYGYKEGQEILKVKTLNGTRSVPLSEALVDPLQKSDFEKIPH